MDIGSFRTSAGTRPPGWRRMVAFVATSAMVVGLVAPAVRADARTVRAGPPILHSSPATAPQLQNRGIWKADPILVSGAVAYRDGEFLYQDFLYDDHGARHQPDPNDPRVNNRFSAPNGTYTYPSHPAYAENAADLVELRVRPLQRSTAFRLTFNTMKDARLIAAAIALGGTPGELHPIPFGANTVAPADVFATVHPAGEAMAATLTDAKTGARIAGRAASVTIDKRRRQIEVRIPRSSWDPGRRVVRLAAGVGLWDARAGRFLRPAAERSSTTPGGAGEASAPTAFFNAAFRLAEPGPVFGLQTFSHNDDPTWWRDHQQGHALAAGDLSSLAVEVDFKKLRNGTSDESGVPKTGSINRILASRFEPGQGVDYAGSCYSGEYGCQYQGNLQPYAIYVPEGRPSRAGYGLTLLLHGNSANYNEFFGTRHATQFGERGRGSIVLTPQARDPGSSYTGLAVADIFEAWADVRRHYRLDPAWTTISGYSLGGLGTFKLAEQYPDLFARAVAIVGSPGTPVEPLPQSAELASLRHVPVMVWDVVPVDELNPFSQTSVAALHKLGYRYSYLAFPGDHFTPAMDDNYGPAAEFLGTAVVKPNPAHVTYVYAPDTIDALLNASGDFPEFGLVADHAYWIHDIRLRTAGPTCRVDDPLPGCGASGTVDAFSAGFGADDPTPVGPQVGVGVLTGGSVFPAIPYVETKQTWSPPPRRSVSDTLTLAVENVASLTIDVARARVSCDVHLSVTTDGPLTVTLAGCGRSVPFG